LETTPSQSGQISRSAPGFLAHDGGFSFGAEAAEDNFFANVAMVAATPTPSAEFVVQPKLFWIWRLDVFLYPLVLPS
jgi:hypothetical protein